MTHGDRVCPLYWQKSAASGLSGCVEVGLGDGDVLVRDSKDPEGHWLRFSPQEWILFLEGVKRGEFDHVVEDGSMTP